MAPGGGGVWGFGLTALRSSWPMLLWILINAALFNYTYSQYKNKPQHVYVRNILGRGLCLSRATAAMLNLSCCLVLLPVCRFFSSTLHLALGRRVLTLWLEKAKNFHKTCAVTVIVAALFHTAAHISNAINFSKYYSEEFPEINWASYQGQNPAEMIFTSVAGLTGVAMLLILVMMAVFSLKYFRMHHYNIFWTTHHSFIIFLVLLLCHPISGMLKELANPESHIPGCIRNGMLNVSNSSQSYEECEKDPIFVPMPSQLKNHTNIRHTDKMWIFFWPFMGMEFDDWKTMYIGFAGCFKATGWLWIALPLILYSVDVTYRILRRNVRPVYILQAKRLPCAALELHLQSNFKCVPGQYVLLQCPVISSVEWHPFSVTSCPTRSCPCFTILVQAKGDWTGDLYGRILVPFSNSSHTAELCRWPSTKPVRFLVDGPYSSPLENVLHCKVAICIAAGVGITPFAAALQHLLLERIIPKLPVRLHLVWLMRDTSQLLWFARVICELHTKFWISNQPDRLDINLYFTRGYSMRDIKPLFGTSYSILRHRLQKGRPKWINVFDEWNRMYKGNKVSVFACGPKSLAKEIQQQCIINNRRGGSFIFTHETFS